MKYEHTLSPLQIGAMTVKNRYAVAPMGSPQHYGSRGEYTDTAIDYYVERARGGFGLIFAGNQITDMEVFKPDLINGPIPPLHAPAIWKESAIRLTSRIHTYGTKIIMQIGFGHGRMRPNQSSASPIPRYANPLEMTGELTREEIEIKIQQMIKTAQLAKSAGFDGVEVHAMHWGYLLDQFAMSISNFRTDEYGGTLDNRLRIVRRLVKAIKAACGEKFVVSIRLGMKSYINGFRKGNVFGDNEAGRTLEEACEIAKRLEEYGYDMISVNSGIYDSFYYCVSPAYLPKGFNLKLAEEVKKHVSIPILTAGRMDDAAMCEKAVADGMTDGIVLGRASLADPYYVKKLYMGQEEDIRPCISCGNCMHTQAANGSLTCAVNASVMRETSYGIGKADTRKNVLIVGGGVAGMEAARVAAIRGHNVTIMEKSDSLGGRLHDAGAHSFKNSIRQLTAWYAHVLEQLHVTVKLGTEADAEFLRHSDADAIILAVGAEPLMPKGIPGIDHEKTVSCIDVLEGRKEVGDRVAIIGAGLVGAEMAYDFAKEEHKKVYLVDGLSDIMLNDPAGTPFQTRDMLNQLLDYYGVEKYLNCMLEGIDDEGAMIKDRYGHIKHLAVDNVIMAIGFKSRPSIFNDLAEAKKDVYEIVAGNGIGSIASQVTYGYEIARGI